MDDLTTDPIVEAPAADAAPAPETPAADPFEAGSDTFDRAYVERLRKESASYRERAKPYTEAFDGIEDGDREVFLQMAKMYKEDPRAAASYFDQVAKTLTEQFPAEVAPDPTADDRPLTVAEYRAMKEADTKAAGEAAEVTRIEHEATTLGYDVGSRSYRNLLMVASELPTGDLKEADAVLKAERQAVIDAYLTEKREAADGPVPPAGSGAAPSGERVIHSFEDAKAALQARIAAANSTR